MALTKEELLQGSRARRDVPLPDLGDVTIRPLTDGEFHQVQSLFLKSLGLNIALRGSDMAAGGAAIMENIKTNFTFDQYAQAEHDMFLLAAAYGLSIDGVTWTTEEVSQLPPGTAEIIAKEVFDLSGADPQQKAVLETFREEPRNGGRNPSAGPGHSPGSFADGADSGSTDRVGGSASLNPSARAGEGQG